MALIHCGECGEQISAKAWFCPKCGHPGKDAPNINWMTSLLFIIAAGVIVIAMAVVISAALHAR